MTAEAPAELVRTLDASTSSAQEERINLEAEVQIVDPVSDPSWDPLVLAHSESHFFHTAAWAKVLCQSYGHKPLYLHISQHNKPLALVPLMEVASPLTGRRGVCLPFSDFCSPLLFDGRQSGVLIEKLATLARERNWKYFELRGAKGSQSSSKPTFYGHKLELSHNIKELFPRFTGAVRRAIRKAEKSGLTNQVAWHRESIITFYRLHIRTRRRHGLPPQPLSFFLSIYENILRPRLGFIVLALRGSCPVAAAVFLRHGTKGIYKFGASDERFGEFRGSNLVMWEGIKFLSQEGAKALHFGRTEPENEGLRRFKLSWGTTEEPIHYLRFDPWAKSWLPSKGIVAGFYNHIFRKLPTALNRLAGAMIYPHLD